MTSSASSLTASIRSTGQLLSFADFSRYSDTFIETGTAMGGGVQQAIYAGFIRIKSVEAHEPYYRQCKAMFAITPGIDLYLGMSRDKMDEMLSDVRKPAVFWLDAHVSGPNGAGHDDYLAKGDASEYAQHNCLMHELRAVVANGKDHIVLIDDQNGVHPQTHEYMELLLSVNPTYKFYFYDEQRGDTHYKDKCLVCLPGAYFANP